SHHRAVAGAACIRDLREPHRAARLLAGRLPAPRELLRRTYAGTDLTRARAVRAGPHRHRSNGVAAVVRRVPCPFGVALVHTASSDSIQRLPTPYGVF